MYYWFSMCTYNLDKRQPSTGAQDFANFATAFHPTTRVKLFIGSKVLFVFCSEICTPKGRGGEKGGSANFKTKHTEPLTQVIP